MKKQHEIKKYMPRVLAVGMSLTIMCSTVGVTAYSAGADQNKPSAAQTTDGKSTAENAKGASDSKRFSKEETVYVIAGADGSPQKVIVSDWVKNPQKADKIKDKSNLTDIENVKGDETYTIDENKMLEWGANGQDIYYKGKSNEQLPVGVSIRYTLDGTPVAPKDLAGKSGKLKMTFTYTNRQYEEVKIGDKKEKIYVPFVILTGMMLDNEKFTNVDVSNGKVINDGSHTYVAGFALPGLNESLALGDKLDLPSTVEITADVTDFELATTLTVATNEVFNDIDTSKFDGEIDTLKKKLKEMTDGVNQLADGTSQLYKGLSTLLDKSGELIDGVDQLYNGADQLQSGAASLDSGAGTLADGASALDGGVSKLQSGATALDSGAGDLSSGASTLDGGVATLKYYIGELAGGLDQISSNSAQLRGGAAQVFKTFLSEADKQIAAAGLQAEPLTIENYASVLDALIGQLSEENVTKLATDTACKTVSSTVESQRDLIRQSVEAAVRTQVTNGVLAAAGLGMDSDSYDAAVAAGQIPDDVQLQVSKGIAAQMAGMSSTIDGTGEAKITEAIESNMQGEQVRTQIAQAVQQAAGGREALKALKAQLDSYNQFYNGILSYTSGVDKANGGAREIFNNTITLKNGTANLASGAGDLKDGTSQIKSGTSELKNGSSQLKSGSSQLKAGASQLHSGAAQLFNGIKSLKNGAGALIDGVTQLKDGSQKLDEGMQKFKKEGADAIVKAVNGNLKGLADRFKALISVSKNYKSFSGVSDDMDGKVDFIFKTDSISTDKPSDK